MGSKRALSFPAILLKVGIHSANEQCKNSERARSDVRIGLHSHSRSVCLNENANARRSERLSWRYFFTVRSLAAYYPPLPFSPRGIRNRTRQELAIKLSSERRGHLRVRTLKTQARARARAAYTNKRREKVGRHNHRCTSRRRVTQGPSLLPCARRIKRSIRARITYTVTYARARARARTRMHAVAPRSL